MLHHPLPSTKVCLQFLHVSPCSSNHFLPTSTLLHFRVPSQHARAHSLSFLALGHPRFISTTAMLVLVTCSSPSSAVFLSSQLQMLSWKRVDSRHVDLDIYVLYILL